MDELERSFDRSKMALMQKKNSVFITTILFSLRHSWTTDIPTASVNHKDLLINPGFFKRLEPEERVFLLAHEAWHVAFKHIDASRLKARDPKVWNAAADYVINDMLIQAGYSMPTMGLHDKQYREMSTEQVYDILIQNKEGNPENEMEDLMPSNDSEEAQGQEIADILVRASTQSKMAGEDPGNLPGGVQRALDALLNPKLAWNVLLQKYMQEYAKEDYSMRRPNRRYLPEFFLPSLYSEAICNITVAIDVSGSVSQKDFTAFLSEVNSIKSVLNPEITRVISFDTRITNDISLVQEEPVSNIKLIGGGGTRLKPVFDEMENNKPTVLIVFSDLYCSPIQDDPGYDVIWVCCDNPSASVNFGRLIHYSTRG